MSNRSGSEALGSGFIGQFIRDGFVRIDRADPSWSIVLSNIRKQKQHQQSAAGVGSHIDMARFLEPAGEYGMSRMRLDKMGATRASALATGEARTVYLCHPFLVHAAQRHRGSMPRFLAQPPLGLREPYRLHREDGTYSPVEISIRQALLGPG